jgi:hypothetical protein
MLSDVPEDVALAASVHVSSIETTAIDAILQKSDGASGEAPQHSWKCIPCDSDQVSSVLARVSPILDARVLYQHLQARSDLGKFQTSIGSTDASNNIYLVEDDDSTSVTDDDDSDDESDDESEALDDLYGSVQQGNIDIYAIMAGAAHAGKANGVNAAHLSKI